MHYFKAKRKLLFRQHTNLMYNIQSLIALGAVRGCAEVDLVTITTLCKVRTSDYLAIPSLLASLFEKSAAVDETPYSCVIL
jgi:hypothetical protein